MSVQPETGSGATIRGSVLVSSIFCSYIERKRWGANFAALLAADTV